MGQTQRTSARPLVLRYVAVGVCSVILDVVLLYLLHSRVGVQLGVATVVAFLTSLVFNFACNRITMSGGRSEHLPRQLFRYAMLVVANLAVTVVVVTGARQIGTPYLIAKLAVVAASTCWNFVLYKRWVFADGARATTG